MYEGVPVGGQSAQPPPHETCKHQWDGWALAPAGEHEQRVTTRYVVHTVIEVRPQPAIAQDTDLLGIRRRRATLAASFSRLLQQAGEWF